MRGVRTQNMAQVALIEDQQVVQTIAVWSKKSSARNRMVLMGGELAF